MHSQHVRLGWMLGLLLAFAVGVHIGLPFVMQRSGIAFAPLSDPLEYRVLAYNIIRTHAFTVYTKEAGSLPELLRTPAYPLFIALIEYVTGSLLWVILAQQLLLFLSAFLVFKTVFALTRRTILASCAGLFLLFEPLALFFSLQTWSETLFVFFLALSLYVIACVKEKKTPFVLGVLFALLVLTRPIGLLTIPIFFIPSLTDASWKSAIRYLRLFLLGTLALLTPWLWRNWVLTHDVVLSSSGTYNAVAGVYSLEAPAVIPSAIIPFYDTKVAHDPDGPTIEGRSSLYTTRDWLALKNIEALAKTKVSTPSFFFRQLVYAPNVWIHGWSGLVFEKYGKSKSALLRTIADGVEVTFYTVLLLLGLLALRTTRFLAYTIPLWIAVLAISLLNVCISGTRMRASILPVLALLFALGITEVLDVLERRRANF